MTSKASASRYAPRTAPGAPPAPRGHRAVQSLGSPTASMPALVLGMPCPLTSATGRARAGWRSDGRTGGRPIRLSPGRRATVQHSSPVALAHGPRCSVTASTSAELVAARSTPSRSAIPGAMVRAIACNSWRSWTRIASRNSV